MDSSGYVILSEESNSTGSFFGEVDGPIMQAMIDGDVYKKIIAYDLQGVCFRNVPKKNIGSILLTVSQISISIIFFNIHYIMICRTYTLHGPLEMTFLIFFILAI